MAIYGLSDTHLSFSVEKPMDVFGSRWKGYLPKLIYGWNLAVNPEDTVVVPGDLSWGLTLEEAADDLRFLDSLNGTKLIGKGNHDFWWQSARKLELFFSANGLTTLKLLHNNAWEAEGKIICGTRGWFPDPKNTPAGCDAKKIAAREVIRAELSLKAGLALDGTGEAERLFFFHFPPVYRDFVFRDMIDLLHKYGVTRCFYGHIHGVYDYPATVSFEGIDMTVLSADYLNFKPLRIV